MRSLALALAFFAAPALAASPTDATLEWDAHPQAADIARFAAFCCPPSGCVPFTAHGGTSTRVGVSLPATVAGSATCTVSACNANGCSGPSNEVIWERPSTGAPPNLRVIP